MWKHNILSQEVGLKCSTDTEHDKKVSQKHKTNNKETFVFKIKYTEILYCIPVENEENESSLKFE